MGRERLAGPGWKVELEEFSCRPGWALTYALHAAVAVVGSALSVSAPLPGALLVSIAVLLTFLDATGVLLTTRRLFGRRRSQNVVARGRAGGGVLVLVAHCDSGPGGVAFEPGLTRLRARLTRALRYELGLLQPLWWALLAVGLCCLLRLLGLEGNALTIIQFVPTVVLIVAVALLLDVALAPPSPGIDDASGPALALALAERHRDGLGQLQLWVVLTGAQEAFAQGMRAFLRRHRAELAPERTLFVNLDGVGAGQPRFTRREGPLLAIRSHPQLVRLCEEIAEDSEVEHVRGIVNHAASDGYAASAAGYAAITLTCRPAVGQRRPGDALDHVDPAAFEQAASFCDELVRRLDLELRSSVPGAPRAPSKA
ncbi:MAG TPA: M28 family peptidase [Thermoleophilaceae bacterium]